MPQNCARDLFGVEVSVTPSSAKPTRRRTIEDILAAALDPEHVTALIEHRQAKKSPLTPLAASRLVNEFRLFGDGNKAVDEMVLMGWTGFKGEWTQRQRGSPARPLTGLDAAREQLRQEIEADGRRGSEGEKGSDYWDVRGLPRLSVVGRS